MEAAAPSTPRAAAAARCETPPRTPRRYSSPPPLRMPRRGSRAPLQRALDEGSNAEVRAVLRRSPAAAREAFLDDTYDPPLNCVVRHGRDGEVARMLLACGADAFSVDAQGFTPLTLLCQAAAESATLHASLFSPAWMAPTAPPPLCLPQLGQWQDGPIEANFFVAKMGGGWPGEQPRGVPLASRCTVEQALDVAVALLAAGADPAQVDGRGRSAVELARRGGPALARLVHLCEHYMGAQACQVLLQACRPTGAAEGAQRGLRSLPLGVIDIVGGFLVPPPTMRRIVLGAPLR